MILAADNLHPLNPGVATALKIPLVLLLLDDKSFTPPSLEGKIALADVLQPELMGTARLIGRMS